MADLPILPFIQERLAEADPTLQTRAGTAFYDLFIKPQEFMLQPLITGMETLLTAQSVKRILNLSNPDKFDTGLVDDLVSNVFVTRDPGKFTTGIIQVLYATPIAVEWAALTAEFDSNNLSFFNSTDVVISAAQMEQQISGNYYYVNYPVTAQFAGAAYNLNLNQGVTFLNDLNAITSSFISISPSGLDAETNTQVLNRAANSIGVRDLETVKGINAIIQGNFPYVSQVLAIGMGDPEMQRDILYNAHVGGYTDIYLKTPAFEADTANFTDIQFDFTRLISGNSYTQFDPAITDPNQSNSYPAINVGIPNLVVGSVTVTTDVIPSTSTLISTNVPSPGGINLTGHEYINLQVDSVGPVNIKISGATPAATQAYEIINSINTGLGLNVAFSYATNQIIIKSQLIGQASKIFLFQPTGGRTDGTLNLFPTAATAVTPDLAYDPPFTNGEFFGDYPIPFVETVDYEVDYVNGYVVRLPGSAILSGSSVAEHPGSPDSGAGRVSVLGGNTFTTLTSGAFSEVQPGDELTILSSTAVSTGTYIVSRKTSNTQLTILGLTPTGTDNAIQYYIISNQNVIVNYSYNPLSIDVGPNVILSDGVSRGIRPGRTGSTITDVAFINVTSIQTIDPVTLQGLGTFLSPPQGFGYGGFGEGPFGVGSSGDYNFIVNVPNTRYSAFEDSVIVFNPQFFGQSFQINYNAVTEIEAIHAFCRNDGERVTGADVLPKVFIPAFVDMTINVRPSLSNLNTPTNAALVTLVSNYIKGILSPNPLEQSAIEALILANNIPSVQTPFTMTATVLNPDGSTVILTSVDELAFPSVVLPSATSNYTTARIIQWYPRNIVITGV